MSSPSLPIATAIAFDLVFGVFVVAFVVLSVITISWAVRRDRARRQAWLARQDGQAQAGESTGPPAGPGSSRDGAALDPGPGQGRSSAGPRRRR